MRGYFDSIPHHDLMKSVARRVSAGAMLALIKAWLQTPVEEDDQRGGKRRTTVAKDSGRGTPQGAPISPWLSNRYMRRFVLGWQQLGWEKKLPARVVVYADDCVILGRDKAEEARKQRQTIRSKLKLTVKEQKTRVCRVPEESFDFLGDTLGRCYSPKTGRSFIGTRPSRKRISVICDQLSLMTQRNSYWKAAETIVEELHRTLRGWGMVNDNHYFLWRRLLFASSSGLIASSGHLCSWIILVGETPAEWNRRCLRAVLPEACLAPAPSARARSRR
jgi:RNA-directed DNA polymerase